MVADLCHVVLSYFRGEKAPRENPPNGDFFMFLHGDLSPRHTKVRHVLCVAFSPLFVVSLPGGTKGRHAKTRQNHHLATNSGENAKGRHAKTRQMMTFSCFRMAIFRSATRKYAKFHALCFRLLYVVSFPGEVKGRHAKTR